MGWFKKLFGNGAVDDTASAPTAPRYTIPTAPGSLDPMDPPPLDMEALAARCHDAIHRQWPDAQTRTILVPEGSDSRVEWTRPNGAQGALLLSKYWHRIHAGETTSSVMASIEAGLARADASEGHKSGPTLDVVLPLFKPRYWQGAVRQQLTATMDAAPATVDLPLVRATSIPGLVITYVEDQPDAMGYVSQAQCDHGDIDLNTLHAHALDNLARIYLPQLVLDGGGGRYVARLDGNYDVSMMLLFDRWRHQLELHGEPMVAVPARNEVLICGDADQAGIEGMAEMALRTVQESPYALTAEVMRWQPGMFEPVAEH